MNMKTFNKVQILYYLFVFHTTLCTPIEQHNHTNYCSDRKTESHFLNPNSSIMSLLSNITICRSQNLYLRTSIGLFQVSSLDYNARLLTISHPCSSSLHYISPLAVTAGFHSPPEPNSLLLFNCSSTIDSIPPFIRNGKGLLHNCGHAASTSSRIQQQEKNPNSCLVIEDLQKFNKDFHPKHLNCSHYSWMHRSSSNGEAEGYVLGTWMSFDVPNHVEDLCKEREKPYGNCGVGLKCLCHAKECKDKIISESGSTKSVGNNVLFSFLSFIGVVAFFKDV
ncbi:uncharacterized protein LOC124831009 [Vigna umbellata]|uniref:uncharacterized protein LOC124831009 n=1 Tax=Vigna umbellata TaxID=87088 RepID=UPI001F5E443B|nr:uncharacterized protein LOC124831009 [Vigna umbellata]